MKITKIISLLLILILCTSAVPAFSQSEIITDINDGDTFFADELSSIPISLGSGWRVWLHLDGIELACITTSGDNMIDLPEALSIGSHILEAMAEKDGSLIYQTLNINIIKSASTENLYADFTGGSNASIKAQNSGNPLVGKDENGEDVRIVARSMEGTGGEANGAVGFYMQNSVMQSNQSIYCVYYYLDGVNNYGWTQSFELSYDLKLLKPSHFEIEIKPTASSFDWLCGEKFLQSNGKIRGTDISYPVGEWMNVRHVVNMTEGKETLYINNEPIPGMTDRKISFKSVTNLKFQLYIPGTGTNNSIEGGQGMAIDNVRAVHTANCNGIKGISYLNSNNEYAAAASDTVTEPTSKIRLDIPNAVVKNKDITDSIQLLADGVPLDIVSAAADADGNVEIELSQNLANISNLKAVAVFEDESGNVFNMQKLFKSRVMDYGVSDVTYFTDGIPILNRSVLSEGKTLTAKISMRNLLTEEKTLTAILTLWDGSRLMAITAKDMLLAPESDVDGTVDIIIPYSSEDIRAECYFADSLSGRTAVSKVWKNR